jgi:phosphopantetheine adenylyltransferase
MTEKLGIIRALKPFSAVQLAKELNASKTYVYALDRRQMPMTDAIKQRLQNALISRAAELITFARNL